MKLRKLSVLPLLGSFLILFNSGLSLVRAQEFVISGNGAGSDNQITAQTTTSSTVTQTNTADVSNNVNSKADTGNNTASANTGGDTKIDTGNVNTQTNIQNSVNTSSVENQCCQTQPSDVTISGNGAGSQNSVDLNNNTVTTMTINNYADIDNRVSVNANTGGNSANYNGGNVSIDTGNINVKTNIKNGPANIYNISGGASAASASVIVADNGANSENNVSLSLNTTKNATVNSVAKLGNIVFVNANTGNNEANGNAGDVSINTGDISIDSTITNDPINTGSVEFNCCEVTPTPTPTPIVTPTPTPGCGSDPGCTTTTSSGGNGGGSGGGSSSGPAVLGLSFTGGFDSNLFSFLAGVAMIMGGIVYTRKELWQKNLLKVKAKSKNRARALR